MADATPTLYDWAGGREPIGRMLNAFYDRVEGDELLAPVFDGAVSAAHREAVTAWWGEVFGGPADYTAHHGGYANMLARHRGLGITSQQRRRFVELLSLPPTTPGCPTTPSSAPRCWPTPSGARAWRCTTRRPGPRSPPTRRCRAGAGARRRPTSPDRPAGRCW